MNSKSFSFKRQKNRIKIAIGDEMSLESIVQNYGLAIAYAY